MEPQDQLTLKAYNLSVVDKWIPCLAQEKFCLCRSKREAFSNFRKDKKLVKQQSSWQWIYFSIWTTSHQYPFQLPWEKSKNSKNQSAALMQKLTQYHTYRTINRNCKPRYASLGQKKGWCPKPCYFECYCYQSSNSKKQIQNLKKPRNGQIFPHGGSFEILIVKLSSYQSLWYFFCLWSLGTNRQVEASETSETRTNMTELQTWSKN